MPLSKLNPNDWREKDADFWRNYRLELTKLLKEQGEKEEKTPQNIYDMAKEVGVKPTARYFNISPSQVRYYRNKYEKEITNLKES